MARGPSLRDWQRRRFTGSRGSTISEQYFRIRSFLLAKALAKVKRRNWRPDLVRLGSAYGGHVVASSLLGEKSVCYSAGVGEDVTFDLEVIRRFGCEVHAFDFTPRSIRFIEPIVRSEPKLHFYEFGLWSSDGELEFFEPRNPSHVSYSALNLQRTRHSLVAPVRCLESIMLGLGHDHVDLLKLDIEGAEIEVLESMVASSRIRPRVICLEFDQPRPLKVVLSCVRCLERAGYEIVDIERWNYSFVARQPACGSE